MPTGRAFGLLDGVVNGIREDSDGNLWVCGRYAGHTRLRPTPLRVLTEGEGLPGNQVSSVHRRRAGGVWIVTRQGVLVRENDRLGNPEQPGWEHDAALNILSEDEQGRPWVAGGKMGFRPLHALPKNTGPGPQQLMEGAAIRSILRPSSGEFWLTCCDAFVR